MRSLRIWQQTAMLLVSLAAILATGQTSESADPPKPSGAKPASAAGKDAPRGVPQDVSQVARDFDPRRDPLDVQVVRTWEQDDVRFQLVTYHVGTFRGQPARMAAFFAVPLANDSKLPGLLHLHGGGQRAFLHECAFYARRGYACLSINWGGREMENLQPGDPNTDWGAVDPTQQNVPGYFSLRPGEKTIDAVESPRNNNWYLLTLAARRGLTFLEEQPQVDPQRLGVYGHSMGGTLTMYVAGTDNRVRAAAPSVGGSGFRTAAWPQLPQVRLENPQGDQALFDATLGLESYAAQVRAPLLWLGSTNDFHGVMDDTYRTSARIPHEQVRFAFAPHLNHRFTPEFAAARPLWFDWHLRAGAALPQTPAATLRLDTGDHVPELFVVPDRADEVARVDLYYAVDRDPRARFWRSAAATADAERTRWKAPLPLLSVAEPLYAFANVIYRIPRTTSEPHAPATEELGLSSLLLSALPDALQQAGVQATDRPEQVIDDFSHGWRDWYRLSADNPHHWEYSTRKLSDPKWRGPAGARLMVQLQAAQPNTLVVVLTENFFRAYRGKQQTFVATAPLAGGDEPQTVALSPGDFRNETGEPLSGWSHVDLLSLRPYFEQPGTLVGSKSWAGPQPVLRRLEWRK